MAVTSFKAKIITSVMLSSAQFMSRFGLQLVSVVVLARLLSPEVYGIFAVVMVFIYLLEMLSEFGLRSLVLTKEGTVEPEFLQTCWTLQILRGLLVFAITILIALVFAGLQALGVFNAESAYNAPVLPWALCGVGASIVIQSLGPTTLYMYEREMKFGHVTLGIMLSSFLGLAITIGVALVNPTVWALVIGTVMQKTAMTLYSFAFFRGVSMRFCWDRQALHLAMDRGKWLWGHSALSAATNSADRLLMGLFLDSATFGFYFLARRIMEFCTGFLQMIDTRMGLQVLTHILQAETRTFQKNYYRYRLMFDALAGTGAGTLVITAPLIVDIVFDDRYAGVAPFLQLLTLALLLTGPLVLRTAFSAERQFKTMTLLSGASCLTIWAGLFLALGVFQSIEAAIVLVALHRLPEVVILYRKGAQRGWLKPIREILPLLFFVIGIGIGNLSLDLVRLFL